MVKCIKWTNKQQLFYRNFCFVLICNILTLSTDNKMGAYSNIEKTISKRPYLHVFCRKPRRHSSLTNHKTERFLTRRLIAMSKLIQHEKGLKTHIRRTNHFKVTNWFKFKLRMWFWFLKKCYMKIKRTGSGLPNRQGNIKNPEILKWPVENVATSRTIKY